MTLTFLRPARVLIAAALLAAGCETPAPVEWRDLPVPDAVSSDFYNGASETRAKLDVTAAVEVLRDAYGPFDIGGLWPVDSAAGGQPATDWPGVEAFYEQAFSRPPLAGSGFMRDSVRADVQIPVAVWTRSRGPLGTPDVLGVLFVPGRPHDPQAFVIAFNSHHDR